MRKKKSILSQYRKRSPFQEFVYRFSQNKGAVLALVILLVIAIFAIFSDVLFDYQKDIAGISSDMLQKPSAKHPFGTDAVGRDLFKRVLYGSRYSLSIAFAVVIGSTVIGVPIGAICGFYGGKVDLFVMRIMNIIGSIPGLLMGVLVISALGQSTKSLIIALAISGISPIAGITRASVMTVRSMEYVEAAKAIGQKKLYIVFRQCLPNCLAPIIVAVTFRIGLAIISASSLSFLGIGVKVPLPEWGALLSDGRQFIQSAIHLTLFPGLFIMITVLAFNMLGDGLRDALDPKLKK